MRTSLSLGAPTAASATVVADEVGRALARLAAINARRTSGVQLAAMGIVAGLGWTSGAELPALLTLGLAMLVAVGRLDLARGASPAGEAPAPDPRRVTRERTLNAAVTGLMWMLASALILPRLGPTEEAVYLLLVCGSLVTTATFLPFAGLAYVLLVTLQVLGLVAALVDASSPWSYAAAMLCILFGVSVLVAARTYRDTVVRALQSGAQACEACEELARSREVERRTSDSKSRFLVTFSHEIRTPMSGVLGAIDLLRHALARLFASLYPPSVEEQYLAQAVDANDLEVRLQALERGRA